MLNNYYDSLKSFYLNLNGFRSKRLILVIESDDWGSIRMPSIDSYKNLLSVGISVNQTGYEKYDSLESEEDLYMIYNKLEKYKDKNNQSPIITANTIVGNPDFEKIKESGYKNYYFETFKESYYRLQNSYNTLEAINYGIKKNIYFPQLHGREHIHFKSWIAALRSKNQLAIKAFENNVYCLSNVLIKKSDRWYRPTFDVIDTNDEHSFAINLFQAQNIFNQIFGFKSESFIAPNYTWNSHLEIELKKVGVNIIQGARAQKIPNIEKKSTIIKKNYMGDINKNKQVYLIRNTAFEPSTRPNIDWKRKVVRDAQIAFMLGAPLVISSHRVNFMGGLDINNRINNLKLLGDILDELLRMFPEIEFMNSVQLGNYIKSSINRSSN